MKKLFTAFLISSIISADLPDGPYRDCINDAKNILPVEVLVIQIIMLLGAWIN